MDLTRITVYANGSFVNYNDAKVGLLTHGLQYGTGCFEGIRGYWDPAQRELMLLQLRDHYERLAISAKILMMQLPHSVDDLCDITSELILKNAFEQDIYVRPCIFKSAEDVGVRLHNVPDTFAVIPIPYTPYFDAARGLKAGVSSWRRADDSAAPPRAKITGLYVNSALAKSEAIANGFDEAIMLSHDGHVSEGSAENLFLIKRGKLYTPDPSQNVLEGCTRRSIMQVAAEEFGIEVIERSIDRSELYGADEMFFTGTAAGVLHISSVDRRPIGDGKAGPITQKLAAFYDRAVRGKESRYMRWLTPVYAGKRVSA
ncbi:MAG TPA: branched-chain amino acid transaminase [Candidatus Baltobacteraceae bacterium]|nr:branched-chain amino acid transaminase [Candidatus Baltobacteraceae bacterium]